MKSMIKASLIATLLVITSCAHHGGCKGGCNENCKKEGQCKMKGEQCPMKSEAAAPAAPATEAPKK